MTFVPSECNDDAMTFVPSLSIYIYIYIDTAGIEQIR